MTDVRENIDPNPEVGPQMVDFFKGPADADAVNVGFDNRFF